MLLSRTIATALTMLSLCLSLLAIAPASAQDVNLDVIFRCAATDEPGKAGCLEARNLITNNCTVCHTFVPIVMQQFDAAGWTGLLDRHIQNGRVNQLSPEQLTAIHDYLAANFNGSLPPPDLPPELLATWTSY